MTETVAEKGSRPVFVALAALVDIACVIAFAAAGRSQHEEAATVAGLWQTAWPFLLALAFAWVVATAWRRPLAVVRTGLPIWWGTLVLGMVLRVALTEGGAPLPFVLVATGALGLALVGWRLVALLVRRIRKR